MEEKISVSIEQELSNIVLGAEQLIAMNHQTKFESLSESLNLLCTDIRAALSKKSAENE